MPSPSPEPKAPALSPAVRERLLQTHQRHTRPRLQRLWRYYRNELRQPSHGADAQNYEPGQASGLPARLRGGGGPNPAGQPAREVVIENDIAWRIHTLVDFMFGRSVTLKSQASDPRRARRIERFLHAAFDQAGGVSFFQDLALLGRCTALSMCWCAARNARVNQRPSISPPGTAIRRRLPLTSASSRSKRHARCR